MATIQQQNGICVEGLRIEWYPCVTARTWYQGEFVYITATGGRIQECATDATTTIGMAASDNAASAVDTMMPVYVCDPNTRYEVNCYHGTPANATIMNSMVGKSYNMFAATVSSYLDKEDQDVPFFHVEKLSGKDEENDLFGRLIVTITPEVAQLGKSID